MATINFYNQFPEFFGDNTIDLDDITNTFAIMLMNSTHAFTPANTIRTDVSANQISTAFGYTQATGGATGEMLASITWIESSGTITWDAANVTWSASGGSIAADDAVIFYDPAASDELVCSIDFLGTQTAGDGTDFVITWNGSGIFTLS